MSFLAVIRMPVAVLLLMAATGKAGAFRRLLGPGSLRRWGASAAAVVAETACGISMLVPGSQRQGSVAAAALGVAFLGYRWRRRRELTAGRRAASDCGCLGDRLRPPPAMEAALPWLVLLGGITGSVSPGSEYASPALLAAGACLALVVVAGLLAARPDLGMLDDREILRSVFQSAELAWLEADARRSLRFHKISRDTWVSSDIAIDDRIINVAARVRTRILGDPVIAITSRELMRFGYADNDEMVSY